MLVRLSRCICTHHFQQCQSKAESVELLGVALFEVPFGLPQLRPSGVVGVVLFLERVDMFDADVADFDFPIV